MNLPLDLGPPNATADVVTVGESSLDYVGVVDTWPIPDRKMLLADFAALVGGQAATAAVACARLGWRARYVGCVGDDDAAGTIAQALIRDGVEAQLVRRAGSSSRVAMILVDNHTGARTVLERRDPHLQMAPGSITPELVSGRVLIVDATDVDAALAAARLARGSAIPVIVDIDGPVDGHEELLRQVNILVANEPAIQALGGRAQTGAAMQELAARYRSDVVVTTLGSKGAVALCQGREVRGGGRAVVVVDTTGAGDAFRAGFAAGWLREGDQADLESVLNYANAVAALNCRALGAQAALPAADEVDRLL